MSEPVCQTFEDGRQEWRLANGQLHRTDGPAYIGLDGHQEWWVDGHLSYVVYPNGTQYWYQNGQRHRTDGPATILANGTQSWWVNGQQLTQQEFELYRFRKWAVEGELV